MPSFYVSFLGFFIIAFAFSTLGNAVDIKQEITKDINGRKWFNKGPCSFSQFKCSNDQCIGRNLYCNGHIDCGDRSDEEYCSCQSSCPEERPLFLCRDDGYSRSTYYRCIPDEWICDGVRDCPNGRDENHCSSDTRKLNSQRIQLAKQSAMNWTLAQRKNDTPHRKWGSDVARIAVALHLIEDDVPLKKEYKEEITYELNLRILSRLALRRILDVPTSELASYVNALLATCIDPRRFYIVDLVSELRKRANSLKNANPFVTLTLCNAGEKMTDNDVKKLIDAFWAAQERHWIDIQALVVMALSCAAVQNQTYLSEIKPLSSKLKQKQYRNGTVENLKTTALVMQALFASESEADEDNFDEEKALRQILQLQQPNGSFGNMINTYYVLPVLQGKSLINISLSHCKTIPTDEKESIENLLNQVGTKFSIKYSLWIGDNRTLGTTLSLKTPANISFYRIMEFSAGIDNRFKFEYNMRNGKPYIYSLWDKQDDPEYSMFWVPYSISSEAAKVKVKRLAESPSDVIPKDKQHLVFWYKSETLPSEELMIATTPAGH